MRFPSPGLAPVIALCLLAPVRASALPDLKVQSFTASVNGSTVTLTSTICNVGDTAATNFSNSFYYSRAAAPGCNEWGDEWIFILGLDPGTCTTDQSVQTGTPNGTYTAWVSADFNCSVGESDEANNKASAVYTVGPAPDLVVQSFTATPSGSTVSFSATVCNNGNATAGSFDLDIYYNQPTAPACPTAGQQTSTIGGLAGGACAVRTFTRTATPPGSYTSWARADAKCVVNESNEANNNASKTYQVTLPPDAGVKPDTTPKPDQMKPDLVSPKLDSGYKPADLVPTKLDSGYKPADLVPPKLDSGYKPADLVPPKLDSGYKPADLPPKLDSGYKPADLVPPKLDSAARFDTEIRLDGESDRDAAALDSAARTDGRLEAGGLPADGSVRDGSPFMPPPAGDGGCNCQMGETENGGAALALIWALVVAVPVWQRRGGKRRGLTRW